MAARKTLSPDHALMKGHAGGVLTLCCTTGLGSPSSMHSHAHGLLHVAAGEGRPEDSSSAISIRRSPRLGGEDALRCCEGGRSGTGDLSFGARSPLQGGDMEYGHRHVGGYAGHFGYPAERPGYQGRAMLALEAVSGSAAVHRCQVCFKIFGHPKALNGHMRRCRRATTAADQQPVDPKQEPCLKEGECGLLEETMARSWGVTRQRGRGRIHSQGTSSQQVRSMCVVTRPLQITEENSIVVASSHRNPAKIPEVKVLEQSYTTYNTSVVPPGATVIIIDDDDDEINKSAGEINASSVTIAISAPEGVATVPALASTAVAATIAPIPYATTAMATAAPPAATMTIAALPRRNGGVAAPVIAGAGEMKVFPCTKCSGVFDCFRGLGEHMATHINMEKMAKEKDLQGKRRRMHVCPKCGKEFETGQSLDVHMKLHYSRAAARWVAPAHSSGFMSLSLSTDGSSACAYKPEFFMATGSGFSRPDAASTSSFLLEDHPPGVMATAHANGAWGRFRLFGVDICTGSKEEPKE